jgi:hypothetical protein
MKSGGNNSPNASVAGRSPLLLFPKHVVASDANAVAAPDTTNRSAPAVSSSNSLSVTEREDEGGLAGGLGGNNINNLNAIASPGGNNFPNKSAAERMVVGVFSNQQSSSSPGWKMPRGAMTLFADNAPASLPGGRAKKKVGDFEPRCRSAPPICQLFQWGPGRQLFRREARPGGEANERAIARNATAGRPNKNFHPRRHTDPNPRKLQPADETTAHLKCKTD